MGRVGLFQIEKEYLYLKKVSELDYYLVLYDIALMNAQYEHAFKSINQAINLYPEEETLLLSKAIIFQEMDNMLEVEKILDQIEVKCLDYLLGQGIYYMLKGLSNKSKELEYLTKAKAIYDFKNINPAFKVHIAFIRAYYALALYDNGEKDEAVKIIKKEWNTLNIHADKGLHTKLKEYFPQLK